MTLVSIGDQVAEGEFAFHSRFNRAANFTHNGHLISVVDEQIGAGPLNIVVRDLNARQVEGIPTPSGPSVCGAWGRAPSLPLVITANTVVFEGRRFCYTTGQRYDSGVDVPAYNPGLFRRNLSVLAELLRDKSPPTSLAFLLDEKRIRNFRPGFERSFAGRIKCSVQQVFNGRLLDGIRGLRGCGLGLTPSGDDFIAGLLVALNLLQKMHEEDSRHIADAIFQTAKGTNVFSNTFLDLARRGLLFGRMKDLVSSLTRGNADGVRRATRRLFAIGESSGADLATGFFMTAAEQGGAVERWKAQCSTASNADRELADFHEALPSPAAVR